MLNRLRFALSRAGPDDARVCVWRAGRRTAVSRRYADDFVVLCRSEAQAAQALAMIAGWTAAAGLVLHPDKTRLIDARGQSFDFLGYRFEGGRPWPRDKSLEKFKDAVRAKARRTAGRSLRAIIDQLNPMLRGWFAYVQHSYRTTFSVLDGWLRGRLRSVLRWQRGGRGIARGTDHQRRTNRFLPSMGSSACSEPTHWPVSPLVGKTTNWRAVCGRSARTVRREGEAGTPLPTPISMTAAGRKAAGRCDQNRKSAAFSKAMFTFSSTNSSVPKSMTTSVPTCDMCD
jgi:hypothetical protein